LPQVAVVCANASCRKTRIELGAPAAPPAESSSRTTNEKLPTVVGFPVVLPEVDSVKPGGRAPPWMDHLYGFTPPAATSTTVPYVTPTSPKWNGRVLMISFAGFGEAGAGDESGDGDSAGVGGVLGVVAAEGVTSGDVVACWLGWVQPARIKTNPATHAAGTTPLLIRL
jgi:hypothetical protein